MAYRLLGRNGNEYTSDVPGTLGGYSRKKVYGMLDCGSALRAIVKGGYVQHRVFFADKETAIAAGYRPCGKCCPAKYQAWKATRADHDRTETDPNPL